MYRLTHINGWSGVYVDLLRDHKTCELRVSGTLGRALDGAGFPIVGWDVLTMNDMRFINFSVTGVDFDTGKSLKLYTQSSEGVVYVYFATCGEQIPADSPVNCCFHWINRLA